MPGIDWRSGVSLELLQKRAELLRHIRSFFDSAGVLEVDTPVLGQCGVTDPHIECVAAQVAGGTQYLQSSPEYFMKRLLAQGSGAIYYLGKVFRDEERGRRHRPEFTMLEWYRPGWDDGQLMLEVEQLILRLSGSELPVQSLSYQQAFAQMLSLDPHTASLEALVDAAHTCCGGTWAGEERSTLLDLLFSIVVEPKLPEGLVFIYDYPSCQAALAKIGSNNRGHRVARRFEVFLNRMEIGNGYLELIDPREQKARFDADIAQRGRSARKVVPADSRLVAALEHGLPDCAGVAIGVDRLLMQLLGEDDIARVIPFSSDL